LTFEIAADGSVTVHFGQWIRDRLESLTENLVACSARRLRVREACTLGFGKVVQAIQRPENKDLLEGMQAATNSDVEAAIVRAVDSYPEVVSAFSGLGLPVLTPGTVTSIASYGGAAGIIGLLYLAWASISSDVGSAGPSTGVKIPTAIQVKPNDSNGSPSSSSNDENPGKCPTNVLDFVRPT
jgi:hypothetical protein